MLAAFGPYYLAESKYLRFTCCGKGALGLGCADGHDDRIGRLLLHQGGIHFGVGDDFHAMHLLLASKIIS